MTLFLGLSGALVLVMNASYIASSTYYDRAVSHRDSAASSTPVQESRAQKVYYGIASWYGQQFHGRTMANGEPFDMRKVSVAHRTLPLGTKVMITNMANGKHLVAMVTDRGPYVKEHGRYTRDFDLSWKAAEILDATEDGLVPVRGEVFI